jgi:hypothetical protein
MEKLESETRGVGLNRGRIDARSNSFKAPHLYRERVVRR